MKSLFGIFLAVLFAFCANNQNAQDFINTMESEADFQSLQREPLSVKYAEAQAVKLVYDLEKKEIYYISNSYEYHNRFCQEVLKYNKPLGVFNRDNYGSDKSARSFLLANINYFPKRKEYILELSPSDHMSISHIEFLHEKVVNSSFLNTDLKFLLNSLRLIESSDKLDLPIITSEEIYNNQEFQAVSKHTSVGMLRKIGLAELDSVKLSPSDIVLINGTPLQLSAVAGVITTELQTPLSHLSILGQNRKVPVMALKDAWENPELEEYLDTYVELTVTAEGYSITTSDPPEEKKTTKHRKRLKMDLDVQNLFAANDFDRKTALAFGYKAENFGVLAELSKEIDFSIPEAAFGIPFYFYDQHKKKAGVAKQIYQLNFSKNPEPLLEEIRTKIKETPVDPVLLEMINSLVKDRSSFRKMRFRSSTNAEDMKGFSGAGLYTSKTGIIDADPEEKKTVERALQKVWASLWNDEAYYEREYFNFNHEDAMMGILVHRSFPDEEVNGVAITKNLYRENNLGFVVNAQLGEESVVQPDPEVTCDQFICYPTENSGFYTQNETIEIITTSNLNDGNLVMTKEEIVELANVLNEIKKYFYYRDFTSKTFNEYGLDFEFKLEKDSRELYLKQVRPYNY